MVEDSIQIVSEKERKCKCCGKTKPIDEFQKYWDKKGGQFYRYHKCRKCKNKYFLKYNREYRKKKRDS